MKITRRQLQWQIRKLLTEVLNQPVTETFVYHGSDSSPEKFVPSMLSGRFRSNSGNVYGDGLYCILDENSRSNTFIGTYGPYVYKLRVDLNGFISLIPDVCHRIYGEELTILDQLRALRLNDVVAEIEADDWLLEMAQEDLNAFMDDHGGEVAENLSELLNGKIKGIIFMGRNDGDMAVIFDTSGMQPVAWTNAVEDSWDDDEDQDIVWQEI